MSDHAIGIVSLIFAIAGLAAAIYFGIDAKRQKSKKDRAIQELRSYATATHSFLVAAKAWALSGEQVAAINDQLQKATDSLSKADSLS